jgi:hypothetical protein
MPKPAKQLAREVAAATPAPVSKPAAKRKNHGERLTLHEEILIEQGHAIDANANRINTLRETQDQTIKRLALLEHQQTDHADRLQVEVLEQQMEALKQHQAIDHEQLKRLLKGFPYFATIGVAVSLSVLFTIALYLFTGLSHVPKQQPIPRQQPTPITDRQPDNWQ